MSPRKAPADAGRSIAPDAAAPAMFAPWQQRAYAQAVDALVNGRGGHALLIGGPPLLGQRALAERLAQRVLCTGATGIEPCGVCRACRMVLTRYQVDPLEVRPDGSLAHPDGHAGHPDLVLVGYGNNDRHKPRTEIAVDQIRALSARLAMTPQFGDAQVAIIEPADALNHNAGNALLKTLEEPHPGRHVWLVTSHAARLPATIRSRCQRLDTALPARDEALAWLRGQGHASTAAEAALDAARGHPGFADAWLRDGGMALRAAVADDLGQLARGSLSATDAAQRWTGDVQAPLRLRHAADLAAVQASGLTDPMRSRRLIAWFDAANRTRELLRTPIRADLAIVELLLGWQALQAGAGATKPGARR